MHRLIFWGIIILAAFLLFALTGILIYWLLRIVLAKPEARIVAGSLVLLSVFTIIVSCWWGHTHTRLQIQVNQVTVESQRLPAAFHGFRIAQISDMHLGSFSASEEMTFFQALSDTIAAHHPDIIVFTGDLVTLRSAEAIPFRQALQQLSHIPASTGNGYTPVFSILGNHDYADYVHQFSDDRRKQDVDSLIRLQEESDWKLLLNDATILERQSEDSTIQHIVLAGVENIGEPPFSTYGDLNKALASAGDTNADSTYTILLSHNPTHWRREVIPQSRIDLTLAGHTHAMQFMIGNWSPSSWKYPEWHGLYTERANDNPQHLYVNTGIGCVGPSVRIGVKPEVTILSLSSKPQK